jgi:uncharacterized protein (DUF885 family)
MPISQMSGPHTQLADLPLSSPFNSVKFYEDYIARLHQIPRVFTQTEEELRAGMKDNLMGRSSSSSCVSGHRKPGRAIDAKSAGCRH